MEVVSERTTKEDQQIAKSSISGLRKSSAKVRNSDSASITIEIPENGDSFKIPTKALSLLFDIIGNMALGKSLTLIPSDTFLSTQQAAIMLNVSRPHLVKLLEEGKIPFKKVGAHRRVELKNLVDYEKKFKESRNKNLNFLAKQAQILNLGY